MTDLPDPNAPAERPIRLRYGPAIGLGLAAYWMGFFLVTCPAQIVSSVFGLTSETMIVLMILLPIAPAVLTTFGHLRRQRDSQRRARGWCVGCGYDLRGSAQSDRCPECGRRIRRRGK